ncbi:H-NS histone family protein [Aeromonas veronii]|uniref:H-NS family histone-like protein n=1 Tax=Aeromonas veronii TaxID=654 RepID=UPI001C5BC7D8|nr:H-NS family nucleoid-associated regulatory protein [Aeromonas veronii]MBW3783710.1 H-NS histone family protein [Aeromonas veronii]
MNDMLAVLMNKRRLKAALNGLTLSQLDSLSVIFQDVHQEIKSDELAVMRAKEEHERKLHEAMSTLEKMGISKEDLKGFLGMEGEAEQPKAKRQYKKRDPNAVKDKPVKPRSGVEYRYLNKHGDESSWYGLGRMPVPMRTAIFNGEKTLEDFVYQPAPELESAV